MDELETRLTDDLRSAADTVVAGESLDAAVDAGRRKRARRQRVLVAGAGVVAVLAVLVGVLAFTSDGPTAVETVGESEAEDIWSVTAPAPIEPRVGFVSAWTGEELLVWGGRAPDGGGELTIFDDGAAYDPDMDTWRALPPAPIEGRVDAVSAWTGSEWLIVGGVTEGPGGGAEGADLAFDVSAYDPETDEWRTRVLPFSVQSGNGDVTWAGQGLVAVGVESLPNAFLTSNVFLIDPDELLSAPLLSISGSASTVTWTGGSGVYISGSTEGCQACLWEVPINSALPENRSSLPPVPTEDAPFPRPPLLWADGLLVGFDTVYDLTDGGRAAPRRSSLELSNHVWTDSVVVGTELSMGDRPTIGSAPPATDVGDPEIQRWWQYEPHTGEAMELPSSPDPAPRFGAQSVWTGEEVVTWGGNYCSEAVDCDTAPEAPATGLRLHPPPLPSGDAAPTTTDTAPPTTDSTIPPETEIAPTTVTTDPTTPGTGDEPEPLTGELQLRGGGTSFGMCAGYCQRTLTFTDSTVELRATGWPAQPGTTTDLMWSAEAELTEDGVALIDAVIRSLEGFPLEETYGCPDCADGGAAWVEIEDSSGRRRSTHEYGRPPPELETLGVFILSLIDSIGACRSDAYVTTEPACTPIPNR